ncbi:MAG: UDP-3-O-(3-hydroxymyristoyl)glucosamine N-acyltransferase [Oscillospiraceae bacterium]|nr:UDP-3-O-(3-hydroxymyristoyl)glucosamine N-acyltransferase [Oscillospiraceae bacterium]
MLLTELCQAARLQAADAQVARDGDFEVFGLLDSPVSSASIVFIETGEFVGQLGAKVSCVICPRAVASQVPDGFGILISESPKRLFFKLHNLMSEHPSLARERFKTEIGGGCRISNMSFIAENNVKIGNNVLIEEFVSVKENTVIGDNAVIRAGTIIGGEGFYFVRGTSGDPMPVRHFGGTIIEDEVEIQQSCCIDRAYFTWDDTVVGQGSKLDNLVHVAHAAKVGRRVFLPAAALLAGNVVVGDDAWVGPGSTISNNVSIGTNARVSLGSVVTRSVADNSVVTGNFAVSHELFISDLKGKFK